MCISRYLSDGLQASRNYTKWQVISGVETMSPNNPIPPGKKAVLNLPIPGYKICHTPQHTSLTIRTLGKRNTNRASVGCPRCDGTLFCFSAIGYAGVYSAKISCFTHMEVHGATMHCTIVSQFQIQEELGRDGMRIVHKTIDTLLDRTMALKFLLSGWSSAGGLGTPQTASQSSSETW